MELQYAINANSKNPTFLINKHIGFDQEDGQGIDGNLFAREVHLVNGLNPELITFRVNCYGGKVRESLDMFDAISNSSSSTRSVMQGFAYSTGGWIPLGADVVDAYDYSSWMCHMPYDPNGEAENKFLDTVANSVATIIANKSGRNGKKKKTPEEILDMMKDKTYYTAQELYNHGLINNVISSSGNVPVIQFISASDVKNHYKSYQEVFNKFTEEDIKTITSNSKNDSMKDVVNRLKLAEGSGENSIIAEIALRENSFNAVNKERDTLLERLDALNKEKELFNRTIVEKDVAVNKLTLDVQNLEKQLQTAKDALEAVNKDKDALVIEKNDALNKEKEAHIKAATERADALVNKFIEIGKIPTSGDADKDASTRKIWMDMAVENYEKTEAILETIPTNIRVPKVAASKADGGKTIDLGDGSDAAFRAFNKSRREEGAKK